MRVGTNISALTANNALKKTDKRLTTSMGKLSSGYKVNYAKDNPAGIAIAKRMNSQIKGISLAGDNAADAISVIETADGALSEIHAILQRMNELAMDAATGTKDEEDRKVIDSEVQQLKEEITRIAQTTDFNGQPLLDGRFDLRGYTDNADLKVAYYSDEVPIGKYTIDLKTEINADGDLSVASIQILKPDGTTQPVTYPQPGDLVGGDNMVKITGADGFELKVQTQTDDGVVDLSGVEMDMTGIGAMRMQIGANEGQVLSIRIPEVSLRMMGFTDLSLADEDPLPANVKPGQRAQEALESIKDAINYISLVRARLGAYQNRLESASANLDVSEENLTSSYSRIMDVDMAEEMTRYTTEQVLIQAGTNMLAQANERPQAVLQLLQ